VVDGSGGVARWVRIPLLLCRPWFWCLAPTWPSDKPREILTVPWRLDIGDITGSAGGQNDQHITTTSGDIKR